MALGTPSLKTSLEFAEKEIEYLKGEMKKATKAVDDDTDEIDSVDDELRTYKRQTLNWRPILGGKI